MTLRTWATCAAIALLSGCSPQNDNICTPLPPVEDRLQAGSLARAPDTDPSTRVFASMTVAEFCVQQAARNFATVDEPAIVVSRAVVGHCSDQIRLLTAAQKDADSANNNSAPVISFRTGEVTTLEARTFAEMEQLALARVVEARAGNCKAAR